ncbi:MAG: hypothetical protein IT212_07445 [Bacteroidia bacterium]|nr:hypothetical protein [Bacteroidia bacterium]
MGAGIHLAMINDMYYLTNASKEPIKPEGHPVMVVVFKKDGNLAHEQHYTIDGAWRQELLKKMLSAAKVVPSEGKSKPTKKDAIGKRLWLFIKEVRHINDDKPVMEDGSQVVDHFIFQVSPFNEGGKKPELTGDPAMNSGIPSGLFIDYKNVAIPAHQKATEKMTQSVGKSISAPTTPVPDTSINMDEQPKF